MSISLIKRGIIALPPESPSLPNPKSQALNLKQYRNPKIKSQNDKSTCKNIRKRQLYYLAFASNFKQQIPSIIIRAWKPPLLSLDGRGLRWGWKETKLPCSFRTSVLIYKVSENQSVALNSSLLFILSVAKNSWILPIRYHSESAWPIEGWLPWQKDSASPNG